jgi:hypothetical protein
MNIRKYLALNIFFIACNSKQVVEDAQCSNEEQDMFMTCVAAGCSATYTQDLSGTDACTLEGGGSVVSVEAGGECGFTSSGSCYVVCDCPEGVGVEFDVDDKPEVTTPAADYEGDAAGECADGADNDRDGLYDCDDPECLNSPDCQEDPIPSDTGDLVEDTASEVEPDPDTGSLPDEAAADADGDGYTVEDGDCDDRNPAINPAASDIVGDSRDQNCDGIDGTDMDRDGFASEASGGDDCNDFDVIINPDFGIRDVTDYTDSNCDGEDGLSYEYKALLLEGMSPIATGDFDGDGLADMIVGAGSRHYIVFGSTIVEETSARLTTLDADVEIHLTAGIASSGYQVKDIDDDGKDDLAWSDASGLRSYLYYGSTIASTGNLIPGSNQDVVVWSSNSYYPSTSITFTDDLTGDGVSDIWVAGGVNVRLARSAELGSGGDASTWRAGIQLSAGHLDGMGDIPLAGLDMDGDGYPEFKSLYVYGSTRRDCYRDLVAPGGGSGDCMGYLNTFKPVMVLPDIDGDGESELSDGYCVQNASSFSDSTYCDYRFMDFALPYQLVDVDGDGRMDFGRSSGLSLTLDILGFATEQIEINDPISWEAVGDYSGDGTIDMVVFRSGIGTYIVGIQ